MINNSTIDTIKVIHRWDDCIIGFTRKTKTGFMNIGSIAVNELKNYFPQFRPWLLIDSYFTVNSPFMEGPYKLKKTGLPAVFRREKQLKYLNALYVDLDVGRDSKNPIKNQSWRLAAYKAGVLMDSGEVPQASIMVRSGRGLYLLWLLHQKLDDTQPEKAFPNRVELYKKINKEINNRFQQLAADPVAVDASRVLRTPGSIHGKTYNEVKYIIQLDENGEGFSYSLDEMADLFSIKTNGDELSQEKRLYLDYGRKTKRKGSCPNRKNGLIQLCRMRIEDLLSIEQHRGGIGQGFRYRVLSLYCEFLHGAGYKKEEIETALKAMGHRCNPPYPTKGEGEGGDTPILSIIKNFKPHKHTSKKLCRLLGVTPVIAIELDLKSIVPVELKTRTEPKRDKKRELRIEALRELVQVYGTGYGCRRFVKALDDIGIKSNRTTVNSELRKIAFELNLERLEPGRSAKREAAKAA